MLKCIARYRNASLRLFVEPGEVLADLSPEQEELLLRDAPGCFERTKPGAKGKGLEAPPRDKMMDRERAVRKESERAPAAVMTAADHPGLVPPKE